MIETCNFAKNELFHIHFAQILSNLIQTTSQQLRVFLGMQSGKHTFVVLTLHWLLYYVSHTPNNLAIYFYNQRNTFLLRNFNYYLSFSYRFLFYFQQISHTMANKCAAPKCKTGFESIDHQSRKTADSIFPLRNQTSTNNAIVL